VVAGGAQKLFVASYFFDRAGQVSKPADVSRSWTPSALPSANGPRPELYGWPSVVAC